MCGRCEGEPYRGVSALFNGDLQASGEFEDRADWLLLSPRITVYLGKSALENAANPLFRSCDEAVGSLTIDELTVLSALSINLGRPMLGRS
jgi:hypothetical protein